ncbi:hypothetical protein H0H81_003894, partial [Sphagnurus paluster]
MSSPEASPGFFDPDDWQLKSSAHSYECTKYQIDLIRTHLDRRELQKPRRIRHFVTEPGVCSTYVADELVGPLLDFCKLITFYL